MWTVIGEHRTLTHSARKCLPFTTGRFRIAILEMEVMRTRVRFTGGRALDMFEFRPGKDSEITPTSPRFSSSLGLRCYSNGFGFDISSNFPSFLEGLKEKPLDSSLGSILES
jgi:hypothetical protein